METTRLPESVNRFTSRFEPGTTVIYPLHGKCTLIAVEERKIGQETVSFYKLEIQRSSFSRSTRQEPAIWVPVQSAKERGLRMPIGPQDVPSLMSILNDREYFFDIHENWNTLSSKLEACIRLEGAAGLAKVVSALHVLRKKQVIASTEVNRMFESAQKALLREISDATGETLRELEVKFAKALKNKTLLSH